MERGITERGSSSITIKSLDNDGSESSLRINNSDHDMLLRHRRAENFNAAREQNKKNDRHSPFKIFLK